MTKHGLHTTWHPTRVLTTKLLLLTHQLSNYESIISAVFFVSLWSHVITYQGAYFLFFLTAMCYVTCRSSKVSQMCCVMSCACPQEGIVTHTFILCIPTWVPLTLVIVCFTYYLWLLSLTQSDSLWITLLFHLWLCWESLSLWLVTIILHTYS